MHVLLPLVLSAAFSLAPASLQRELHLSSLHGDCKITREWIGLVMVMPWGIQLDCGGKRFLITHPLNLLGHVTINTPDQALEYVRFFSSLDSFSPFLLDGMVEILPTGKKMEERYSNELDAGLFDKHFKRARVRELPPRKLPAAYLEEDQLGCCKGKEFEIIRVVMFADQKVCEIVEYVSDNGFYDIESTKVLLKNGRKLGLVHLVVP